MSSTTELPSVTERLPRAGGPTPSSGLTELPRNGMARGRVVRLLGEPEIGIRAQIGPTSAIPLAATLCSQIEIEKSIQAFMLWALGFISSIDQITDRRIVCRCRTCRVQELHPRDFLLVIGNLDRGQTEARCQSEVQPVRCRSRLRSENPAHARYGWRRIPAQCSLAAASHAAHRARAHQGNNARSHRRLRASLPPRPT